MSLQGKVITILDNGNKAKVKVRPVSDCNGCKACAGLIKANKNNLNEHEIVVITNGFQLKENDVVKLDLSEYQGSKAALILYGLPILGFMIGMLVTPLFCNLLSIALTDGARVICSFVGVALAFLFIFFHLRAQNKDSFMMHVTAIISQD